MAGHEDPSLPQQPSSIGQYLDNFQSSSLSAFPNPLPQPTITRFGQVTPQNTVLLTDDPPNCCNFDGRQTQVSHNALAVPMKTEDFFIRFTSVLKASFRKTPTPSDTEISRLAIQTGLDEYCVSTWFDIIRGLLGDGGLQTPLSPRLTQPYIEPCPNFDNVSGVSPTFSLDLDISATAEELPIESAQPKPAIRQKRSSTRDSDPIRRQRKRKASQGKSSSSTQDFSQKHRGKALDKGRYCCPTCNFKTGIMDQWYTHQSRKHFPSEVFVCRRISDGKPCNKGVSNPCKGKDNFATHLKDSHGYHVGRALDEEVSKRTIKVTGLFHDKCGFCGETLDSRERSIEHIGAHVENGDKISDWAHQCTSLDHRIRHHVHFEIPSEEPETDDDNPDQDDADQGDFGGWTQGGDYDPSDHEDPSGSDPDQPPGENKSGGAASGLNVNMRTTTATSGVLNQQAERSERYTLAQRLGKDSLKHRTLESLFVRRKLGSGGSGIVFEVSKAGRASKVKSDETYLALKIFRRVAESSSDVQDCRAFTNEVRIMKRLRHSHVVQLLDSCVRPTYFSLLLAPVADMDLATYMKKSEQLPLHRSSFLEQAQVMLDGMSALAAALKEIHSQSISHNDIKPANILIKDHKFLLADFGISSLWQDDKKTTRGNARVTPEYAAPETIKSRVLSRECDVWSLGCVFSEIATSCMSRRWSDFKDFRATSHGDTSYHKTLKKTKEWIDMLDQEQQRRDTSHPGHSIPFYTIREMLSENPEDRPSAHEVWLRFPKCTCCSDWQYTYNQPPADQSDVEDQALNKYSKPEHQAVTPPPAMIQAKETPTKIAHGDVGESTRRMKFDGIMQMLDHHSSDYTSLPAQASIEMYSLRAHPSTTDFLRYDSSNHERNCR